MAEDPPPLANCAAFSASSDAVEASVDDEEAELDPEANDGAVSDEFEVEFDTVLPFVSAAAEPARGADTLFV